VVTLDKLTYSGNAANLGELEGSARHVFVPGDITDQELVGKLLRVHAVDAVLNLAAETHVDRSLDGPEVFVQTNVIGTLRLLNAARAYWKELNGQRRTEFRFVQVSTDEVYGTLGPGEAAFTEETAYRPNSPYAASKAAGDHLARAYHASYGLPVIVTNCSNNYGPHQFPEKLIPLMILNAREGRELPVYGDGLQVRDWLYVEDHAAALWRVATAGRTGETYNIGGGTERANLEVVKAICRHLDAAAPRTDGRSYAEQIVHVADRPGHDRRYAMDGGKLKRELGWQPTVKFEDGLARTVDWYLGNAEWCARITVNNYARERLGTAR
jgi:dTDP-glucose 4,6-dehydratase